MEKMKITEEMGIHKQWLEDADKQTIDTLIEFMNHVLNDYEHDYGTIIHAISVCALAACYAADKTPNAGITGFQAGAVMWQFIKKWQSLDCPLQLRRYDKMLYPQYLDAFQKTIPESTMDYLKNEAKILLERDKDLELWKASPDVVKHWQSIVDGHIPFGYTISDDEK